MEDSNLDKSKQSGLDVLANSTDHALDEAKSRLESFTAQKVKMAVPKIIIPTPHDGDLNFEVGDFERDGVRLGFKGRYCGSSYLLFDSENIHELIKSMTGAVPSDEDWEEVHDDFLAELGNIVLNTCVGSLSNKLQDRLTYSPPQLCKGIIEDFVLDGFQQGQEACFVGIGLFNIEKLKIYGNITFTFYFDKIEKVL